MPIFIKFSHALCWSFCAVLIINPLEFVNSLFPLLNIDKIIFYERYQWLILMLFMNFEIILDDFFYKRTHNYNKFGYLILIISIIYTLLLYKYEIRNLKILILDFCFIIINKYNISYITEIKVTKKIVELKKIFPLKIKSL